MNHRNSLASKNLQLDAYQNSSVTNDMDIISTIKQEKNKKMIFTFK